jgi:oligoribonuclease NrnB/cAMP/cGMP phosphodiesterase (DHH superfamily)
MFERTVVLDHHKTAQEALSNWTDKPENLEIVFDMNRSGAGITWDYFSASHDDLPLRPPLIDYVEDRDIWKFALSDSKIINSVIGIEPLDFDNYDGLNQLLLVEPKRIKDVGRRIRTTIQSIYQRYSS